VIETGRWKVPAIFEILARHGRVEREEMYQVFNMGIGMIAIVAEKNAREMARRLKAKPIGRIAAGSGITRLVF
jgi:phosphoribosylformylglycinamidine cyclo-ligase